MSTPTRDVGPSRRRPATVASGAARHGLSAETTLSWASVAVAIMIALVVVRSRRDAVHQPDDPAAGRQHLPRAAHAAVVRGLPDAAADHRDARCPEDITSPHRRGDHGAVHDGSDRALHLLPPRPARRRRPAGRVDAGRPARPDPDPGRHPALPAGGRSSPRIHSAGGTPFAGDFVVATRVGDPGRLELVIVDVSGKGADAGTRALLLSGAFGGLLGASRPRGSSPPPTTTSCARTGTRASRPPCTSPSTSSPGPTRSAPPVTRRPCTARPAPAGGACWRARARCSG